MKILAEEKEANFENVFYNHYQMHINFDNVAASLSEFIKFFMI